MPFAVGVVLRTVQNIKEVLNAGAEKVVINTYAAKRHDFIREAAEEFGSSTIVVSFDVKKKLIGKQQVYIYGGTKATGFSPLDFAKLMEEKGACEIIINSIKEEGLMGGYDIELICTVSDAVSIPVVSLGGAGIYTDFKNDVKDGHASEVASGSLFVYHGPRRAVLINYPTQKELLELYKSK